jgi:hypothetical protein
MNEILNTFLSYNDETSTDKKKKNITKVGFAPI